MPAPSVARCGNYVVRTRPTGRTLVVFLSLTGCLRDAAGRRRSGRRPAAPGSAPAQVRRVRGLPADRLRQVFGLPRHGQVRRHRTQVCCWFLFFFSAQLPSSCYILFFFYIACVSTSAFHSKQSCVLRKCPNMAVQVAEDDDIEAEDPIETVRLSRTRTRTFT